MPRWKLWLYRVLIILAQLAFVLFLFWLSPYAYTWLVTVYYGPALLRSLPEMCVRFYRFMTAPHGRTGDQVDVMMRDHRENQEKEQALRIQREEADADSRERAARGRERVAAQWRHRLPKGV